MDVKKGEALTAECDGEIFYFCSEGCRDKFLKDKACKFTRSSYDLIIIGGGPAGLTAAVYAATLKIDTFMLAKDLGGQAIDSTMIENYMGYDFITGTELTKRFQDQLIQSHYIGHRMTEAREIKPVEDGFHVTTSEKVKYFTKTVLIATGMTRRRLRVPGEEEFQRKGVFYGNLQDLSFVQGESAAVIGGGNSALQIVENLHTVAKKIHLISNSKLKADPVIIERISRFKNVDQHEEYEVLEFRGAKILSGISIKEKGQDETTDLSVKGVFIAIGLIPNSSLVSDLVKLNERNEIIINPDCSTSTPGIFAAGDVTDAFGKRIIIASGEGAKAAMAARQYILNLRKNVTPA